jgi:hypothetical protein
MSLSITGTYQNGQIKLDTIPHGIERARVTVEFEEQPTPTPEGVPPARHRGIAHFGMFAPADGTFTTDEDLERVKKSWNTATDEIDS